MFKAVLAGLIMFVSSLTAHAGLIYQASEIKSSLGLYGSSWQPELAIDQSQLSHSYIDGVTDLDEFLALNPTHGNTGNWSGTYFGRNATGFIDFDLGKVVTIDTLLYWGVGGADPLQNIKGITLFADDDGDFGDAVSIGDYEISYNESDGSAVGVDTVKFSTVSTRYIRMQVNSDWGRGRSTVSEIAFAQSNSTFVNVPEPSTFAIFALGILGLASRKIRK